MIEKKIINVNNSGYVESNQNSLIYRLCRPNIIIQTEPYRFILKSCTWVMFKTLVKRQEVLAIEYFQIKLMLWNNKLSRIFYLIGFQNPIFLFLIISNFSIFQFCLFLQHRIKISLFWNTTLCSQLSPTTTTDPSCSSGQQS